MKSSSIALPLILASLFLVYFPSANADLNEGLVAYWSFDDCTAKDDSTNGNNGSQHGTQCVQGQIGKALDFNGTSDYVEIPASNSLDTRYSNSMFAWINPRGNYGPIFNYCTNCWGIHLWQASGTNSPEGLFSRFVMRNGSFTKGLEVLILEKDKWHFIGTTYDANTGIAKLYDNGVKVQELTLGKIELATQYPIRMGLRDGDARVFNGLIDEARIYNRALTDSEVTALYQQGTTTTSSITSITPTVAVLNQPTTFTLTGTNLKSGMGFTIGDCDASNTEVGTGSDTQRQFECTPRGTAGQKTGSVLNADGSSLYTFKALYYDLTPDHYDLSIGGKVTVNEDRTKNEFWVHRYYNPSAKRECYSTDKDSVCATHTGRDTHTENHKNKRDNKIKSYGFGRVKKAQIVTTGSALSYISITHLLSSGEDVQANLLHGLYDNSINNNDYIVKKQLLGTESDKGAAGRVHLHTEIASSASTAWIYTSNAVPSLDGTRSPKPEYSIDDLTAHYDKNKETLRYYSPDDTFNNHSELLPWLSTDNQLPSFESGFSVYGVINQPLYGQLKLKRTEPKDFKAIGILIKNGSIRKKTATDWLDIADINGKWLAKTWNGNIAYNDPLVVPVNVLGDYSVANSYSYTQAGDYLAIPFVSMTSENAVNGYPIIFSMLDNKASKVIDNDKVIDNAQTVYTSSGINKQKTGYYLTSDIAFGKSGATAKWLPNVAGNYRLSVFIPETTNSKVVYKVKTSGTTAQLACVIQNRSNGAWAPLVWSPDDEDNNGDGKINIDDLICVSGGSSTTATSFNFSKNGYVVISLLKSSPIGDNAHLKSTEQVVFDAIKFDFVIQ